MGRIKKILENDLVGGIGNTDVYPVTSTKAVYDSENNNLDTIIAELRNGSGITIVNWDTNAQTTRLSIKLKDRKSGMYISYKDGNNWVTEQYIANSLADVYWRDNLYWRKISFLPEVKLINVNAIEDIEYTLSTAVSKALVYMKSNNIPRNKGIIITYKTGSEGLIANWEIAQYCYEGTQNDNSFSVTTDGRWVILPNKSTTDTDRAKNNVPNFEFNPIPNKTIGLKILTLGDECSMDTWEYVPNILRQAGITDATIVYAMSAMGSSLQDYYNLIISGTDAIRMNKSTNSADFGTLPSSAYTLDQILANETWDIVVLQQSRFGNYDFTTFEPYMSELISYIRNKVRNRKLCIMFNMLWAGDKYSTGVEESQRYNDIVQCTKDMIAQIGIPYIIPSGTAIQFGRKTEIETANNWTRNGHFADLGVGRYVLAATTFQYIFGYIYNKDVRDYRGFTTSTPTAVTSENIDQLNQCAVDAVNRRFITENV